MKEYHPADEKSKDIIFHLWIPVILAVIILTVSLLIDYYKIAGYWTQRAGSIVTVIGVYIAYYESKVYTKYINDTLYINPELQYKIASFIIVIIGTILWGYGDIIIDQIFN